MAIITKIWTNGEFTLGFTPQRPSDPMGLSDASNSVNRSQTSKNAPRGTQNKFSSNAKRTVRNACELLGSTKQTSFLTVTLPPLTEQETEVVSRGAAVLIHRFTRWLTRRLIAAKLPGEIVTVREFQKRGALHWHFAFIGTKRKNFWAIGKEQFKAQWARCLSNLLGREVDCSTATRVESVRKSVSRYLSKYMSKSNDACKPSSDDPLADAPQPVPVAGRAWNISNSLRRRIKIIRSEKMALIIWNHRGELPFVWLREFEWEGKVVGLVGQLPWKGEDCRHELQIWQDNCMSAYQ